MALVAGRRRCWSSGVGVVRRVRFGDDRPQSTKVRLGSLLPKNWGRPPEAGKFFLYRHFVRSHLPRPPGSFFYIDAFCFYSRRVSPPAGRRPAKGFFIDAFCG